MELCHCPYTADIILGPQLCFKIFALPSSYISRLSDSVTTGVPEPLLNLSQLGPMPGCRSLEVSCRSPISDFLNASGWCPPYPHMILQAPRMKLSCCTCVKNSQTGMRSTCQNRPLGWVGKVPKLPPNPIVTERLLLSLRPFPLH